MSVTKFQDYGKLMFPVVHKLLCALLLWAIPDEVPHPVPPPHERHVQLEIISNFNSALHGFLLGHDSTCRFSPNPVPSEGVGVQNSGIALCNFVF